MTLAELLKALVECEDQMERMALVEANQDLMTASTEETQTTENEGEWESKYNDLKKKYIDTFFGGTENTETVEETTSNEDTETQAAESITIDDLLKGEG